MRAKLYEAPWGVARVVGQSAGSCWLRLVRVSRIFLTENEGGVSELSVNKKS